MKYDQGEGIQPGDRSYFMQVQQSVSYFMLVVPKEARVGVGHGKVHKVDHALV